MNGTSKYRLAIKQYIINNIKNFFQSNFDSIPYDVLSN